jgi:hypothetical protein
VGVTPLDNEDSASGWSELTQVSDRSLHALSLAGRDTRHKPDPRTLWSLLAGTGCVGPGLGLPNREPDKPGTVTAREEGRRPRPTLSPLPILVHPPSRTSILLWSFWRWDRAGLESRASRSQPPE